MTIHVDPLLLSTGTFELRWFTVLVLMGLGLGLWLTVRQAGVVGVRPGRVLAVASWAIPAGLVGARALAVLSDWDGSFTRPSDIWRLPIEGLLLWGGIALGGVVAAFHQRRDRFRRARLADAVVPGLALAIAIGQLGAFLNGAGQGTPTALPWGTSYTSVLSATPDFGTPRHPVQLYVALAAVGLLLVVRHVPPWAAPGMRFWLFLAGFGSVYLLLGSIRLDTPFLFALPAEQIVAGAATGWALIQVAAVCLRPLRSSPRTSSTS